MAGMGTAEAIQYWVLSDVRNEVRGKPKRIVVTTVEGRSVAIWQFPNHPAGGQFRGHYAAIATVGSLQAIASIHGDNAGRSARLAVALAAKAAGAHSTVATSLRRFDQNGIAFQYPRSWFVTTRNAQQWHQPQVPLRREQRSSTAHGRGSRALPVRHCDTASGRRGTRVLREALGTDRRASLPRMQPRPQRV